jgi:hypothetical protein
MREYSPSGHGGPRGLSTSSGEAAWLGAPPVREGFEIARALTSPSQADDRLDSVIRLPKPYRLPLSYAFSPSLWLTIFLLLSDLVSLIHGLELQRRVALLARFEDLPSLGSADGILSRNPPLAFLCRHGIASYCLRWIPVRS